MKKMKFRLNHYSALVFICIFIVTMSINLIVSDKAKSLSENRSLQQYPVMNMDEVLTGDYQSKLNTWFSDQFVGRDFFVHTKYLVSKWTGLKQIDNVFICKDRLIEDANDFNETQFKRNVDAMNAFYTKYPSLRHTFVLAPNAVFVQKEYLPQDAEVLAKNEQFDYIYTCLATEVVRADIRATLNEHKDEYLYYKTDHHWTSLGAYYAFLSSSSSLGIGNANADNYDIYLGTDSFVGTLANKTGSVGLKDTVELYVPKDLPEYVCTNVSTGKSSRTIYSSKGLSSNDAYTVFFGGNAGLIRLEMNNSSNKRLLVFKDSYANAYLQFLIPYYRTITIIDPRYYYDDVNRLIQSEVITDILYMYNTNTFVQDTSLADVIGS